MIGYGYLTTTSHPIALNWVAFVASRKIALTGTPASRNFDDVEYPIFPAAPTIANMVHSLANDAKELTSGIEIVALIQSGSCKFGPICSPVE